MRAKKLASPRNLSLPLESKLRPALESLHMRAFHSVRRSLSSTLAFDPHIKRGVTHLMTDTEAFINLLKCAFGTGCLAMPRAYVNAGWLLGSLSTIFISAFVVYAMHVLINDMITLCKRYQIVALTYSETMEIAILNGPTYFHKYHKPIVYLVDILLCIYHFGVDCVYVVFIAKNLKHMGDIYFMILDIRIYIAMLTVPLMLAFLIRDIKYLVPFAAVANLLLIISFIIIFKDFFGELPSLKERAAIKPWAQYPLCFGTVLFAIESVGVIIALHQNMHHPDHYLGAFGVLNRAMFIVVVFYTIFGFLGYWRYGDGTAGSILNNLAQEDILTQLVLIMFALAIFLSYALQGYITVDIIWRNYMAPRLESSSNDVLQYLLRMAMVIASVLCAMGYPDFVLLLSFVGSFCLAQLGLIYPGVINLCVQYNEGYGFLYLQFWRSLLFIAVGIAGGIAGTVASLVAMKEQYTHK